MGWHLKLQGSSYEFSFILMRTLFVFGNRQHVKGFTDIHSAINLKDVQYTSLLESTEQTRSCGYFAPWKMAVILYNKSMISTATNAL